MRYLSFLPLLALGIPGHASHSPLSGRLATGGLQRRASLSGTMSQLGDSQNLVYLTNVSLNNEQFSIMIDTGSSDLWVSKSVPEANAESFQAEVSYASGSASGSVMSATFDFADFSVDSQFFIEAPDGNAAAGAEGLIGLGPSAGSTVRQSGNSSAANPPLDRIFTSNSSISSYIAILLQRSQDPEEPYPGDLGVGEVLTQYQDVLNQPQHLVPNSLDGYQHWLTFLDVNGIIGPDGNPIEIKTQVTGAQTENATVVFDTGFTLPQVSPSVAQALYGNIPGAVLTNVSNLGEIWVLSCDQQINATFLFGGVEFPIHPLDLNFDGFNLEENGETYCVGAFQPYSFDIKENDDIVFDMILGMAFLRNAYMVINFGNLLDAATPTTSTAYIQLLPLTNATQAAQDFASVRGSNSSYATSQQIGQIFGSGSSTSDSSSSTLRLIAIIAGVAIVLILLVGGLFCCLRRRRVRNAAAPANLWTAGPTSYQRINEPSPQAAYDIHMAPRGPPAYAPAPEYRTAWDPRY